ncbi:MAG: GSU2403 family nucleotidyltransferase fold protein [Elusimicrobiota bacterium]
MQTSYPGKNKEDLLLRVLKDIQQYRNNVILIGGWLPYIYKNFLWKTSKAVDIIGTQDIDFALKEIYSFSGEPIAKKFNRAGNYKTERVYNPEELPVYFYASNGESEMRIDFISHEFADPKIVRKLTGEEIEVIPLEYIELLLRDKNIKEISIDWHGEKVYVRVPAPAAYLFVKTIALSDRAVKEDTYKFRKDLWTIFFIFDNIPQEDEQELLNRLQDFKSDRQYYDFFIKNIQQYFASINSPGPKAVSELLNIPEEFIKRKVLKTVTRFIQLFKTTVS